MVTDDGCSALAIFSVNAPEGRQALAAVELETEETMMESLMPTIWDSPLPTAIVLAAIITALLWAAPVCQ